MPSNVSCYPYALNPTPQTSNSANNSSKKSQSLGPDTSSDEDNIQYLSIDDFVRELSEVCPFGHYFADVTADLQDHGYLTIDQLADPSLDVEHMMKLSPDLKEGTAHLIKKKAIKKVKHIQKHQE